ncbi:MAG: aminopeptidase [Lachnospiraceae bacterium]|nr:aminopeptidase [Lachnospiraceae bacterium]
MTDNYPDRNNTEYIERYGLAYGRIKLINSETAGSSSPLSEELSAYFHKTSAFIIETCEAYNLASSGLLNKMDITDLKKLNKSLYEDINGSCYIHSYAEPDFATGKLGMDIGTLLCVLYTEMRVNIVYAFEKRLSFLVPLLELYIQVYNILEDSPSASTEIRDAIYYYFFDYADIMAAGRIRSLLDPGISFATDIIMQEDLSDPSYLYLFGEYISENELKTSEYLSTLPGNSIKNMASTFTEGYRKGFEAYNIDLSKKGTVNIRYVLGFERIVREAIRQFAGMGLKPCIYRAERGLIYRSSGHKNGYYGGNANRQYDYDHRMDESIIFDKAFADRRLSAQRKAFEDMKELASLYAGPAVMETFGETDFIAADKKTAPRFNEKQQEQRTNFMAASSLLTNEFIPGDTTSFTIIAYPVPSIGNNYHEIFNETIKVNTLDSSLYEKIQTCIINALDAGDFVTVTGRNGNITNINVALSPLNDPAKETKFENCLADVNIPLGEVFTSPQLKGTNGLLHATSIYLDGLIYKDLKLEFKDGIIASYSCRNFDTEEENHRYIHENLLHQHKTLPLGEFAIGTNTTAYQMGQKYNIEHKLPILITEKTGPHFAIGDTCFSHEEELRTYNPDGKEMKCKENDFSMLRHTDINHAYFNCHTDITIPYNELGDIIVQKACGTIVKIIENGQFVLPGTEELNKALE